MSIGYMILCSHFAVNKIYQQLLTDIKQEGKVDLLDLMHHLSSGMKSIYTQTTMDGLMVIR